MRIDHVAHPCRDPHETHRFYGTTLGLQLVQAYAGDDLMLVYALPEGGSLVFTRTGADPDIGDDEGWERRHVGLTVATRAEFERWLGRLMECGVRHRVVDDERIYFSDPDGLVLEIEVESAVPVDPHASDVLARWRG